MEQIERPAFKPVLPSNDIPDFDHRAIAIDQYASEHSGQILDYAARWLVAAMAILSQSDTGDGYSLKDRLIESLKSGTTRKLSPPIPYDEAIRIIDSIPPSIIGEWFPNGIFLRQTGYSEEEIQTLDAFELCHCYKVYINPGIRTLPAFVEKLYEILDKKHVKIQDGKIYNRELLDYKYNPFSKEPNDRILCSYDHRLVIFYIRDADEVANFLDAVEQAFSETQTDCNSYSRQEYPFGIFALGGRVIIGRDYPLRESREQKAESFDSTTRMVCTQAVNEFFARDDLMNPDTPMEEKNIWMRFFLEYFMLKISEHRKTAGDFLVVNRSEPVMPHVCDQRALQVIKNFLCDIAPISDAFSTPDEIDRERLAPIIKKRMAAAYKICRLLRNNGYNDDLANTIVGEKPSHGSRQHDDVKNRVTAELFVQRSIFYELANHFGLKETESFDPKNDKNGVIFLTAYSSIVYITTPADDKTRTVGYIPIPFRHETVVPEQTHEHVPSDKISPIVIGKEAKFEGILKTSEVAEIFIPSPQCANRIRDISESVSEILGRIH